MAEKNFRINTNISKDCVVNVNLTQDYDTFDILTLNLTQSEMYRLHTANYGVIVGRVLANDAFGIPNAKISVFIPFDNEDTVLNELKSLYSYESTSDKDGNNIRYNLLPSEAKDDCHRAVGTFPSKRFVLDNDSEIEIFDKYYKYSTVSNNNGDFMLYGVPTGMTIVHTDLDLSDCGILSQKPRDFFNKGYNIEQFDNAEQFKESTNLDNLTQIISQDKSIYVYPFWGDSDAEKIAITRCDMQIQYKFEPTCIFMGSMVTDDYSNNINHKCRSTRAAGKSTNLVTAEGTVEMIRKTPDGFVEEYQINGNQLIDGDGVWCYQIPMNLDYVGTDEYGNIVPTKDSSKGIPTRTSVRFRFSVIETDNEGFSRHRAKFLVPNNPKLVKNPYADSDARLWPHVESGRDYNKHFNFGSNTLDEDFRDLFWNNVYTVKSYIPRTQASHSQSSLNYNALKSSGLSTNSNPFPFNHAQFTLNGNYRVVCLLAEIVISVINILNQIIAFFIVDFGIKNRFVSWHPFKRAPWLKCIRIRSINLSTGVETCYFPGCNKKAAVNKSNSGCEESSSNSGALVDNIQQQLALANDMANFDFYNDWLNGCLYFPLWYWRKTRKKSYFFGLFHKKAKNQYCSCSVGFPDLRLAQSCALQVNTETYTNKDVEVSNANDKFTLIGLKYGLIKETTNRDGANIYYYTPGNILTANYEALDGKAKFVRLYATDIVLLGNLNDCNPYGLPKLFANLPSSTANIPFIVSVTETVADKTDVEIEDYTDGQSVDVSEEGTIITTGMDWGKNGKKNGYRSGLFFDLSCTKVSTLTKTCVNLARLSELGVSMDSYNEKQFPNNNDFETVVYPADGMITQYEIDDNDSRAMFASMNHQGFTTMIHNDAYGYDNYKLSYLYPTNFDGFLGGKAASYSNGLPIKTYDKANQSYDNFRLGGFGTDDWFFYNSRFPLFNNSFYFYFGLNEGRTAIDKFHKLFYSECFNNNKFNFYLTITNTKNGNICKPDGCINCYGAVIAKIESIRKPYSYTIYDSDGTELFTENNMYANELYFGYDGNDRRIFDGRMRFNDGKEVKIGNETQYWKSGDYTIKVTDSQGIEDEQEFTIKDNETIITYNFSNLGVDINDTSIKNDVICNCTNKNAGHIYFNSFEIDTIKYYPKSIVETNENFVEATMAIDTPIKYYKLKLGNGIDDNGDVDVKITLSVLDGLAEHEIYLCSSATPEIVEKGVYIDINDTDDETKDDELVFAFTKPHQYLFNFKMECDGDIDLGEITIPIVNGSETKITFNDYPLELLDDKILFSGLDGFSGVTVGSNPVPNVCYLLNDPNSRIYKTNNLDRTTWKKILDITVEDPNDDPDADEEDRQAFNLELNQDIVKYRLNLMLSTIYGLYSYEIEESGASFSLMGGRSPYLYETINLNYSVTEDEDYDGEKIGKSYISFNSNSFTNIPNYPNMVNAGYGHYNKSLNAYTSRYDYSDENLVLNQMSASAISVISGDCFDYNLIGMFDNNGGINTNTCRLNKPFVSYPYLAKVIVPGDNKDRYCNLKTTLKPNTTIKEDASKFLKHSFIDKRIGCDLFIEFPVSKKKNCIKAFSSNPTIDKFMRRGVIYGEISNHGFLAVDDNKNLLTKLDNANESFETEYAYYCDNQDIDNQRKIIYNPSKEKRKPYKFDLKLGKYTYSLKDIEGPKAISVAEHNQSFSYKKCDNYYYYKDNNIHQLCTGTTSEKNNCFFMVDDIMLDDDSTSTIGLSVQGYRLPSEITEEINGDDKIEYKMFAEEGDSLDLSFSLGTWKFNKYVTDTNFGKGFSGILFFNGGRSMVKEIDGNNSKTIIYYTCNLNRGLRVDSQCFAISKEEDFEYNGKIIPFLPQIVAADAYKYKLTDDIISSVTSAMTSGFYSDNIFTWLKDNTNGYDYVSREKTHTNDGYVRRIESNRFNDQSYLRWYPISNLTMLKNCVVNEDNVVEDDSALSDAAYDDSVCIAYGKKFLGLYNISYYLNTENSSCRRIVGLEKTYIDLRPFAIELVYVNHHELVDKAIFKDEDGNDLPEEDKIAKYPTIAVFRVHTIKYETNENWDKFNQSVYYDYIKYGIVKGENDSDLYAKSIEVKPFESIIGTTGTTAAYQIASYDHSGNTALVDIPKFKSVVIEDETVNNVKNEYKSNYACDFIFNFNYGLTELEYKIDNAGLGCSFGIVLKNGMMYMNEDNKFRFYSDKNVS